MLPTFKNKILGFPWKIRISGCTQLAFHYGNNHLPLMHGCSLQRRYTFSCLLQVPTLPRAGLLLSTLSVWSLWVFEFSTLSPDIGPTVLWNFLIFRDLLDFFPLHPWHCTSPVDTWLYLLNGNWKFYMSNCLCCFLPFTVFIPVHSY